MRTKVGVVAVLLFVATSGCTDALAPDVDTPPTLRQVAVAEEMRPSLFMQTDYRCEEYYGWGCSDWGGWMNAGPWDNPIHDYCLATPERCAYSDFNGAPVANPTVPIPEDLVEDDAPFIVPDCSVPQVAGSRSAAWCSGDVPKDVHLTRYKNALNRMRALGGVCAELAAMGDLLLANGRIRIFSWEQYRYTGGFAPLGGGATGPNAYVGSSDYWVRFAWDNLHRASDGRTLQSHLAHEIDHLAGRDHLANTNDMFTPNTIHCGGMS